MVGSAPILEMRGISKRFPGVQALSRADFRMFAGEVHALMGQNGAGKSTLIKVLTGVSPADAGKIVLDGKEIRPDSPLAAQALGISTVYQEVNLCPNLSVAENIFLGRGEAGTYKIRWRQMRQKAEELLGGLNLDIDVTAPIAEYSIAVQQMAAIARSLSTQARILILDEPTSSLAEEEVKMLFSVIRRLKAQGMAILFVTHFLDQLFEISDRITVLRNGEHVGEYPASDLSPLSLITKMVGREIAEGAPRQSHIADAGRATAPAATDELKTEEAGGAPFLHAENLGRRGSVNGVSLEVRSGQSVGMGGLLGSGRTETARLLFGIDRADEGSLKIAGTSVRLTSPLDAIKHGIGFCPEDRKVEGVVGELSLRENVILALQAKRGVFDTLTRKRQQEIIDGFIRLLGIKAKDAEVPVATLSGGNQQKVLLARWMATDPRMLILDEPTRGIDVAAKLEIMQQVMDLCEKGMAVLFISSEMDEVVKYSDKIVVMRDRRKVGEIDASGANEHTVFEMIAGGES
jgi:simple sugar transport system ATP-binding protein